MTDDATLREFLETGNLEAEDVTETTARDERDSPEGAANGIHLTCAWGEYTCRECDSRVDRVWCDRGVYVCFACKSW